MKVSLENFIQSTARRGRGYDFDKSRILYWDPYSESDLYDQSTLYYGHLKQSPYGISNRLYEIPYCTGSDYSGSTVERSNYLVMLENFAPDGSDQLLGLWPHYGGYSTYGIVVDLDYEIEVDDDGDPENIAYLELAEIIVGLEDYPVVDEGHWSEFEYRICFEENFNDWIDSDIRFQLHKLEHDDPIKDLGDIWSGLADDDRLNLFYNWPRWEVEGPEYEIGCTLYIRDMDDLVEWIAEQLRIGVSV